MKSIVIIGGGAAGMMAAIAGAGTDWRVILLEKNTYLGAKVIISGGGRCNLTTGITDRKKVLENYPRGAKFLKTAIYGFDPLAVREWFHDHGVRTKVEDDLRVFPVSDNGKEVVDALEKALRKNGVELRLNSAVSQVSRADGGFEILLKSGEKVFADSLIITTGGNAYRQTGSTGDGYSFAQALGHSLTKLAPSLASLKLKEDFFGELAGLSFEKVGLTFEPKLKPGVSREGQEKFDRQGPIVFTHQGVSGPAVFALVAKAAFQNFNNEPTLSIDFFPDLTVAELDRFLMEKLESNRGKLFRNVFGFLIPQKLVDLLMERKFLQRKDLDLEKINASEVSKELRHATVELLKNWRLLIKSQSAGDEFVTAGGVPLEEVDSKTMQSKIVPGLFFAGEILDVDGFTGGFNLQASWAAGVLAGKSSASFLRGH